MSAPVVVPDLVIIGAARSGTSFLAGSLDRHPDIDGGSVKEPNYFSSRWEEGPDWYAGLFRPPAEGRKRVDASVSYTYPQHPRALERIRDAAPDAQIVYTVREPLARLVSHYQLMRYYYDDPDKWGSLEHSIDYSAMFLGAGDYGHWLDRTDELFGRDRVLVVPFPAITDDLERTAGLVLSRIGLDAADSSLAAPTFRNEVRDFRVPGVRAVQRRLRRSQLYPRIRSLVGPARLRSLQRALSRKAETPSAAEELATLGPEAVEQVRAHAAAATAAVEERLHEQDARLGLDWAPRWRTHVSGAPPLPG